jgi:hypothetical protein
MTASPHRARLPNRRPAITQDIIVNNITLSATLGFDEAGRPAEIFLSGAKDGSGLAAILEDASVVISVALQRGVRGSALAKSIARIPESLDGPAVKPTSPIGAALTCSCNTRRRRMGERLAFLLDGVPEAERTARCRELRALAFVYLGLRHPLGKRSATLVPSTGRWQNSVRSRLCDDAGCSAPMAH